MGLGHTLGVLLRRLGVGLLTLWGVVTVLFLLLNLLGDPAQMLVGQRADPEALAAVRARYGLDQPLLHRYGRYLLQLSPLRPASMSAPQPGTDQDSTETRSGWRLAAPDMGYSLQKQEAVHRVISRALGPTLLLGAPALLLALLLGTGLGVWSAWQGGRWGSWVSTVAYGGLATPSYVLAVLLLAIVARLLPGWPTAGYLLQPEWPSGDLAPDLRYLLLPLLALSLRPLALFLKLTQEEMHQVLRTPYLKTARAKGLEPRRLLLQHALPNALNPVLTAAGNWLAALLTGAVYIEVVFGWPGVGLLLVDSLLTNDYPVVLGIALYTAAAFTGIQILVDLLQVWLNPRMRLAG